MKKNSVSAKMRLFLGIGLFFFSLSGCFGGTRGGEGEDNNNQAKPGDSDDSNQSSECSEGGGYCGTEKLAVTVDLSDAQALFTVQQDASSSSSGLVVLSDQQALTTNTSSPLFAVTPSGIKGIMEILGDSGSEATRQLPRLSYVAANKCGDVFLAFEHSWIFRNECTDSTGKVVDLTTAKDPWSPSSCFTCQLFHVSQKIGSATGPADLICVDDGIEISTWDSRTRGVQFDDDCNAYYTAHVPGNWKNLLYKYNPTTRNVTEVINANIQFKRFLVTNNGGVLYTGYTSVGDQDNGGDNFFRYVTPWEELIQITSGWWDYTFAPIESKLENCSSSNDYCIGQILFYGPDPLIAKAPEWDDSCLFRFDPASTGSSRSTQIADCNIDIWAYINYDDDNNPLSDATRKSRCTEAKAMMGGGNQPEKILLSDYQDSDGLNEIYVVGDIYEKNASEWRCDICSNGTPGSSYCHIGTTTLRLDATTSSACTALGGTFDTSSSCYNNQVEKTSTGNVCTAANLPTNMNINSQWCEFSGNASRSTRSAIARVEENYDGNGNKRITRLSANDEIVSNGWAIGNRLPYSAFNVTDGTYELLEVGNATPILTGIEVYELMKDPRNSTKWFFNGLRFGDNQYILGTFNPDASNPKGTLQVESGLTGQIDTLVIIPD
ncbi:MAG: hypothetical protein HY539_02730 [Deltaproteobacteria bacterium]|nr:hypothetical protein [Deltaproteobacteria bacterium]